jgi:hypothetical protein
VTQGGGAQTINRTTAVAAMDDGQGGFNAHVGDSFAPSPSMPPLP